MKIQYDIKNISGKNKALCIGDLIRYYGETKYKIIDGMQKLNDSETKKGMVAGLLKKVVNNPSVDMIMSNLEEFSKKNIIVFAVDGFNPLVFDNGTDSCVLVVEMGDEYFAAKAIYGMMKPGFRKMEFEDHVDRERKNWIRWFEKNLKEYSNSFTSKILEE